MKLNRILRADGDDWKRVRAVRLAALGESPDAFGSTLVAEEQFGDDEWRRRVENPRVGHFLAEDGEGCVMGLAVGAPYTGHEDAAGLFGMWVAPTARRHGVGTGLVNAVISWARHEGYQQIILDVAQANTQAVELYESCGFRRTGNTKTLPPPRDHILEFEMCFVLA